MTFSPTGKGARPSRRTVIAGTLTSSVLASCADPKLFLRNAQAVASPLFGRNQSSGFTRAQIAQIPAASIAVSVGADDPQLMLLTDVSGNVHQWAGAGHRVLETRGGRITKTGGFGHDLANTTEITADPAQAAILLADQEHCDRALDFTDSNGMDCEALSVFRVEGPETLVILGAKISTLRIVEHVRVKALSWRHKNTFWAEMTTGYVWRSRQHTHPSLDPLTLTTMRPANA